MNKDRLQQLKIEWVKDKQTRHQENVKIFTGRRDGLYYEKGQRRGQPIVIRRR